MEMKPALALHVPGNTEAERMDNAVGTMFTVSKEDLLKREANSPCLKTLPYGNV
jgi:hypothetical protein